MATFRRVYAKNHPYFITITTEQRRPLLVENIITLRQAFAHSKQFFNYEIDSICILPDHLHMIIFPENENDPSEMKEDIAEGEVIAPVDMSLLEDYADTPEEIKSFIEIFIRQSKNSIEILQDNCIDGACTAWVESAHKLKGGCGMVGAQKLMELCAEAQKMSEANGQARESKLKEIVEEYGIVSDYLNEAV